MAVIVTSYGKLARKTLRYPKAEKPGNDLSNPRVLASTGVNVSVEGAERVFAMLRRKHGSKGAQSFQTIVSFSKAEMNPDDPADRSRGLRLQGRQGTPALCRDLAQHPVSYTHLTLPTSDLV